MAPEDADKIIHGDTVYLVYTTADRCQAVIKLATVVEVRVGGVVLKGRGFERTYSFPSVHLTIDEAKDYLRQIVSRHAATWARILGEIDSMEGPGVLR